MASSNTSKTEKKKKQQLKTADASKAVTKSRKKEKDSKKEKEKKKDKKLNVANGNSKHRDESLIVPSSSTESEQKQGVAEEEEDNSNTLVTNGRTTGKSPKKSKVKRDAGEGEEEGDAKTTAFPMNRIRTIIKSEDPDSRVSQEAILAINKAAEKFLEQFTQDGYVRCVQERKKSLSYNHLVHVVSKQRRYEFLSDFVPEKLKAEDALRERNSGGNGR